MEYPFVSTYIPERFLIKAEDELTETYETMHTGLEELRNLIQKEPDFTCRTTDDFLIQFLRARKYNIQRAFNLLKKYMKFKRNNVSYFTGFNFNSLNKLISSQTIRFLPYRDRDGCAILVVHLYNWSPSESSIKELIRCVAFMLYYSINDPMSQINGYKIIFDVRNKAKHLVYVTPTNLYLLYNGTQECFPGRYKGIHFLNMGVAFKIGWALVYPFLSDKLKSRIFFHDTPETLRKFFPDYILPLEFGGQLRDEDSSEWLRTALEPENLEKLAN